MQISNDADKIENKLANFQITKSENNLSNLNDGKQGNKQYFNLPDLSLSSALGLFTPDVNNNEDQQQAPMKRRKKKPKRGFRQS